MAEARDNLQSLYASALRDRALPVAFVDVDAFDHNLARLLLPAGLHGKRVRLATKSLRCPTLVDRAIQRSGGLIGGLMGYEAHVAGLPDDGRLASWQNPMKRWIKERSWPDVLVRRGEAVRALQDGGLLPADGDWSCNGGGSGSVDRTAQDPSVTEITIGSGLLVGHLFDGYRGLSLKPSLHFALAVTRIPGPGLVTCGGGGWIASGSAGADRLPMPVSPAGSALLAVEGAGEVQTPVSLPPGIAADIGDAIVFRPAKSGELAEVFAEYALWSEGAFGARAATYRGLGWSAWG